MNSKIYRCGWCGCPTNKKGELLDDETHERVVSIIEEYGDNHTEQTHGYCCINEQIHPIRRVTRDMAIDAGDLSLEGQII